MLPRIFVLNLLLLALAGLINAIPGESTLTSLTTTQATSLTETIVVPGVSTTYTPGGSSAITHSSGASPSAPFSPTWTLGSSAANSMSALPGFSSYSSLMTEVTSASVTSPSPWPTSLWAVQPTTGPTMSTSSVSITGSSSLTTITSVVSVHTSSTTLRGSSSTSTSSAPSSSTSESGSSKLKVPTVFVLLGHMLSSVNGFAPNFVRQANVVPCPAIHGAECILEGGIYVSVGTLMLTMSSMSTMSTISDTTPRPTLVTTSTMSESTTSSAPTPSTSKGASANLKVPAFFLLISHLISSVKAIAPNAGRQAHVSLSAAACPGSSLLYCVTQGGITSTLDTWRCADNSSVACVPQSGRVITAGPFPPTTAVSPTGLPQPAQPNTTSSTGPTTSQVSTSQTTSQMPTTTGSSSIHTVSSMTTSSATSTSTSKSVAPTMAVVLGGGSLAAVAIAAFMAL